MRRVAFVAICVFTLGLLLSGCGTNVAGVPDTVAKVNGKPIEASTYLEQISRRYGQDVLRNMIEQQIILQWAKDEKVPVTDKQVQQQIDILKRDGNYEDQVKLMGENNIKAELEALQARMNLAKKLTKVTEPQLQQVYDGMKQRYVHGARKQIALIINPSKAKVEEALKKVKSGKDFDEVSGQYTDPRFSFRGPIRLWVDESQPSGMPPSLLKAAKDTKVGELSGVVTLTQTAGPSQYAVVKVLRDQPKMDKSLDDVKDEVKNMAALQNSQMDPEFVKKLNKEFKAAKIEVGIKEFKDVANGFKNPAEPSPMMMTPQRATPSPRG